MKPKFLLINPWIYDFSAVNMWSRPLGLLRVAEYLSRFDADLHFIDCMDVVKRKRKYGTGQYPRQVVDKPEILKSVPRHYARYGIDIEVFKDKLKGIPVRHRIYYVHNVLLVSRGAEGNRDC